MEITKQDIIDAYYSKDALTIGKDINGNYVWAEDDRSKLIYHVREFINTHPEIKLGEKNGQFFPLYGEIYNKSIIASLIKEFSGKQYEELDAI
jgi:hypothetical protein